MKDKWKILLVSRVLSGHFKNPAAPYAEMPWGTKGRLLLDTLLLCFIYLLYPNANLKAFPVDTLMTKESKKCLEFGSG